MRRFAYLCGVTMIFTAPGACAGASPGNPLGFYVGVEGGTSDIRLTSPNTAADLHAHTSGWGAFAGLRPISFIGAELEYFDFGDATAQTLILGLPDTGSVSESAHWRQRATTLMGMIYAPLPTSPLDLYAKAGVAHLQTTGHVSGSRGCGNLANCQTLPPTLIHISDTDTRFAYGAGVQLKVSAVALRVEYQQAGRAPDLLSLGLSFTF